MATGCARKEELTWEILEKSKESRTSEESQLVEEFEKTVEERNNRLCAANEYLREHYPLVCSGDEKSLIPAYGWIDPVTKMAKAVEALNILYKKHRVYAAFDQCKEKYGDFRGYFTVEVANSRLFNFLVWPIAKLDKLLKRINIHVETVEVYPSHELEIWRKKKADEAASIGSSLSVVLPSNDKEALVGSVCSSFGKFEKRAVNHKILWWLSNTVAKLYAFLDVKLCFLNDLPAESIVIRDRLDDQVDDLISKCEAECRDRCIDCGNWIDTSNGYTTSGWISFVCRRCAMLRRGGLSGCESHRVNRAIKDIQKFNCNLREALDIASSSNEQIKRIVESGMLEAFTTVRKTLKSYYMKTLKSYYMKGEASHWLVDDYDEECDEE